MKPSVKSGGMSAKGAPLQTNAGVDDPAPSSALEAEPVHEGCSKFDAFNAASALVASLGYPAPDAVTPLPGGRNNQVWRVRCGHQSFLLKHYFWSEQDPRDRLGQEWAFLHYLRKIGCWQAPEPLVKGSAIRCSLIEFIEGVPLEIHDVTEKDIHAANDFFIQMNSRREKAASLPPVSEACFSIESHIATMSARVERLEAISHETDIHAAARDFVDKTIRPLWRTVEKGIRTAPSLSLSLKAKERCLSPSDFGFHNALRQSDGRLRFLDFEYAGWDDPAKTIIDFCNQPDRLLSDDFAGIFRESSVLAFPNPQTLAARIRLLEPLYQLKWACICLNTFLPRQPINSMSNRRNLLLKSMIMANRSEVSLDSWKQY